MAAVPGPIPCSSQDITTPQVPPPLRALRCSSWPSGPVGIAGGLARAGGYIARSLARFVLWRSPDRGASDQYQHHLSRHMPKQSVGSQSCSFDGNTLGIKLYHLEFECLWRRLLGIDGYKVVTAGDLQAMTGICEHARLGARERRCKVADLAIEVRLVEVDGRNHLPVFLSIAAISVASFLGFASSPGYLYAEVPITSASRFAASALDPKASSTQKAITARDMAHPSPVRFWNRAGETFAIAKRSGSSSCVRALLTKIDRPEIRCSKA
jgi:hypothetical protein